ncbi:site-specific recombinase XerD [Desulfitispora alkaliphila]|uniref:tyrosine-type recombinase/integrase n=1 Tax=Desulfitispora alkaliphila TaxID=622674 RepID=UPI003D26153C
MLDLANLPAPAYKFLDYLERDKNYSKRTVKSYASDLSIFFRWLLHHRKMVVQESEQEFKEYFAQIDATAVTMDMVDSVTENEIRQYFRFAESLLKLNINAKTRKIASLKSFYKYLLVRDKSIKTDPTVGIEYPKMPKKKHIFLSMDEVERLFAAVNETDSKFKMRNKCILILFLNTGMRLSELTALDLDSIRSDFTYLSVIGKGNAERFIPLNEACKKALLDYLKERPRNEKIKPNSQNAIFLSKNYSRMTPRAVQNILKDLIKKADLPDYITVHKLRHTFATHLYDSGAADVLELQQLLGHKDISTTKIYTNISQERLKHAVDKSPFNK